MRGHACQYTTNGSPLLQIAQHRDLQLSDHSSIAVYSKQFMRRELVGSNSIHSIQFNSIHHILFASPLGVIYS